MSSASCIWLRLSKVSLNGSRLTVEWSPALNLLPWHNMATPNITSSSVQRLTRTYHSNVWENTSRSTCIPANCFCVQHHAGPCHAQQTHTHLPTTDENDRHRKTDLTPIALAFAAKVTSTSHCQRPIELQRSDVEDDFHASITEELSKPQHADWLTPRCTRPFRSSTSID